MNITFRQFGMLAASVFALAAIAPAHAHERGTDRRDLRAEKHAFQHDRKAHRHDRQHDAHRHHHGGHVPSRHHPLSRHLAWHTGGHGGWHGVVYLNFRD